jgi:type IV secretory pathway TrbL component
MKTFIELMPYTAAKPAAIQNEAARGLGPERGQMIRSHAFLLAVIVLLVIGNMISPLDHATHVVIGALTAAKAFDDVWARN